MYRYRHPLDSGDYRPRYPYQPRPFPSFRSRLAGRSNRPFKYGIALDPHAVSGEFLRQQRALARRRPRVSAFDSSSSLDSLSDDFDHLNLGDREDHYRRSPPQLPLFARRPRSNVFSPRSWLNHFTWKTDHYHNPFSTRRRSSAMRSKPSRPFGRNFLTPRLRGGPGNLFTKGRPSHLSRLRGYRSWGESSETSSDSSSHYSTADDSSFLSGDLSDEDDVDRFRAFRRRRFGLPRHDRRPRHRWL